MTREYARRGQLAGKSLTYVSFATVRGEKRRNNPDGVSVDPYFPVALNSTLQIRFDRDGNKEYEVQFDTANKSLVDIIDDINTAIGSDGSAYEMDGVLHIRTVTEGSDGAVEVYGGTAAAVLGFRTDLGVVGQGGDLEFAAQGRIDNPYSAVFPVRGENLDYRRLVRAMGKLATNIDVVRDEVFREAAAMGSAVTISAQDVISNGALGVISMSDPTISVFTGRDWGLTRTSTPEELATYFQVIDSQTKVRSFHKVVAVVIGTVAGDPPYADAANLQGNGNVLGLSFERISAAPITAIHDGCIVQSSTNLSTVRPGDIAEIAGASTSSIPWSNVGKRWVVEEVIGTNYVRLRAMSFIERVLNGITDRLSDPITELNAEKTNQEDYGTITFHTGAALNNVKFVISPAIPDEELANRYSIQAALHTSSRNFPQAERLLTEGARFWNMEDGGPNMIVQSPEFVLSGVGGARRITVSGFNMRLNGRLESIPSTGIVIGAMLGSKVYVYFDEDSKQVKATTTQWGTSIDLQRKLIGVVAADQLTVQGCAPTYLTTNDRRVTVGDTGQFATLESAIAYVTACLTGVSSAPDDPGYRAEIVVQENIYLDQNITLEVDGIHIRGISPDVNILHRIGETDPHFLLNGHSLYLTDLTFDNIVTVDDENGTCFKRNVTDSGVVFLYRDPDTYLRFDSTTGLYVSSNFDIALDADEDLVLTANGTIQLGNASANQTNVGAGDMSVEIGPNDEFVFKHSNTVIGTLGRDFFEVTLGSYIQTKPDANFGGAAITHIDDADAEGALLLTEKAGASPVLLSRSDLATLIGGPTSDASSLHTHVIPNRLNARTITEIDPLFQSETIFLLDFATQSGASSHDLDPFVGVGIEDALGGPCKVYDISMYGIRETERTYSVAPGNSAPNRAAPISRSAQGSTLSYMVYGSGSAATDGYIWLATGTNSLTRLPIISATYNVEMAEPVIFKYNARFKIITWARNDPETGQRIILGDGATATGITFTEQAFPGGVVPSGAPTVTRQGFADPVIFIPCGQYILHSTDCAVSWSQRAPGNAAITWKFVKAFSLDPAVDSDIIAVGSGAVGTLYYTISNDGGVTWSTPVQFVAASGYPSVMGILTMDTGAPTPVPYAVLADGLNHYFYVGALTPGSTTVTWFKYFNNSLLKNVRSANHYEDNIDARVTMFRILDRGRDNEGLHGVYAAGSGYTGGGGEFVSVFGGNALPYALSLP